MGSEKYLVLLVDREKARLFTVRLGKIEENQGFLDLRVPQKVKAKKTDWGRDDKIFRHIEGHLKDHLQMVARKAGEFIIGKNIHFVILGGHRELLPKMRTVLPYPVNKMVKGQFISELNIPVNDVFLKSKEQARRINQSLPHRHA